MKSPIIGFPGKESTSWEMFRHSTNHGNCCEKWIQNIFRFIN